MLYHRICPMCHKEFDAERPHGEYCSDLCRQENHRLESTMKKTLNKLKKIEHELRTQYLSIRKLEQELVAQDKVLMKIKTDHEHLFNLLSEPYVTYYNRLKDRYDDYSGRSLWITRSFEGSTHEYNLESFTKSKNKVREEYEKSSQELDTAQERKDGLVVDIFTLNIKYRKFSLKRDALRKRVILLQQKAEPEMKPKLLQGAQPQKTIHKRLN